MASGRAARASLSPNAHTSEKRKIAFEQSDHGYGWGGGVGPCSAQAGHVCSRVRGGVGINGTLVPSPGAYLR